MSDQLVDALRRNRDRRPHAVAVRTSTPAGWQTTTWARLHDAVLSVAGGGGWMARRAPVVVLVDGTADSIAIVLGLAHAGVDLLLLEGRNSFLTDNQSAVRRSGASIVVGPGHRPPDAFRYLSYEECGRPSEADPVRAPCEPEILQLTSGSTGEPRVARQPLRSVLHGGELYRDLFELTDRDVVLAAVPLAHSFGLVGGMAAALVSGATLCTVTRFQPRRLLEALDSATTVLGTPLVYELLAPLLPAGRYAHVRNALSSGGPLAPAVAESVAERLGTGIRQIYGSTETGLIACADGSADPAQDGLVGHPAPGVEVRVAPGDGRLLVRTRTMFTGYLGEPVRGDGFYDTGDLARLEADCGIVLIGRKETFVNVGGRKVNPRRIERVLVEHPGVREAFVYGAGGAGGEEVNAAVVLAGGTRVEDVVEFCRSHGLMPYEVPHRLHVLDRLPRTGMGKVDPRAVAAATDARPVTSRSQHHLERLPPVEHPVALDGVREWQAVRDDHRGVQPAGPQQLDGA
ncbi:class I adenylate-forming enzyme family protein [Micromonosporaceae bacterium B7E4]